MTDKNDRVKAESTTACGKQDDSNKISKSKSKFIPNIITIIKLLIALVGLATAVLILYNQNEKNMKLINVAISDIDQLRSAIAKPMEGNWSVNLNYAIFRGDSSGVYRTEGKAIFLWNPTNRYYDVYLGASLRKNYKPNALITWFMHGTLNTDVNGLTSNPFDLIMQYLNRTGVARFAESEKGRAVFSGLTLKINNDISSKYRITGNFSTSDGRTIGVVEFIKEK